MAFTPGGLIALNQTTIAAQNSATALSSIGPGAGFPALGFAKIGFAVIGTVLALKELKSERKQIAQRAAFNRNVAIHNAKKDNEQTEISAFRLLSTQTAQATSGGFLLRSGSTLAILAQTENDKDARLIRRNEALANQLRLITLEEQAARKRNKFGVTKALTSGILGAFG